MSDPRDCKAFGGHFASNGRCYYCGDPIVGQRPSREPISVADDILGQAEWDDFYQNASGEDDHS